MLFRSLNDYIKITVQNGKTAETGGSVPVIGNASHLKVLSTGGIGTAVFITAGLAIIAGTLAMALKVRKKKKD